MNEQAGYESCSRYIDWSLILNNIVTKCMSRNTTTLFPIMFVLPQDTFKGIDKEFDLRDKNPLKKEYLFGGQMKYIGMINIVYQKDFKKDRGSSGSRGSRSSDVEKRFWTLFLFRVLDVKLRKSLQSYPLTGNKEEYILINYNGQVVNYGDLFGQVPITYMELNQLTQKYKMHCFFTELNGSNGRIPVLYMTPAITEAHQPIIEELELKPVIVEKPRRKVDEIPSHSFIIRRV
jgi:hypothetical protein